MTMYLVRHGLAAAGVEDLDPGLDTVGHAQARATAEAFRDRKVTRLVVSPLRRTRETAAPIGALFALRPEIRNEVAEVFDPNMPAEERRSMIGPFMAGRWSGQPDHLRAWRDRVVEVLTELARESDGSNLVVVSHYIAIGVAIGAATGDDRVVPTPIANCSITSFDVCETGLQLLEAAATGHLSKELVTGLRTALPGGSQP